MLNALLFFIVAVAVLLVISLIIIQMVYPRLLADLAFITDKAKMGRTLAHYEAQQPVPFTIVDLLERHAESTPDQVLVIHNGRKFTYADVNRLANRVAYIARRSGFRRGDKVALLFENEPALIWTLFGFSKLGVTCALLNFNLRSKSLLHCIDISEANTIVVGPGINLAKALEGINVDLRDRKYSLWRQDANGCFPEVLQALSLTMGNISEEEMNPPKDVRKGLNFKDPFVYVYTSGTTGMPKASRLSHKKMLAGGQLLGMCNISEEDKFYITLPLYHVSALFIGLSNAVTRGATVVLRSKFSATHFWEDCCKYEVTVILYIGELFRYLLARSKTIEENNHKVRMAVGNGLGGDIWANVTERFSIPKVIEMYGATEANFGIMNTENKLGSVGCWSPLLKKICAIELIKYDYETASPLRNEKGRCVKVPKGEIGLLICPISKLFPLEGYVGKKELTEKKMLRNVFKEGDVYFNTGDLFIQDREHYLYFKDRIGDTFRWKGENVATTEVSQVMNEVECILETNVYGVNVPGYYGKAGMAAIILHQNSSLDLAKVYNQVTEQLPNYAWPRFLRLSSIMEHTSTFKQTKVKLIQEGFDPLLVQDSLFVLDQQAKAYAPLDKLNYDKIITGVIRL